MRSFSSARASSAFLACAAVLSGLSASPALAATMPNVVLAVNGQSSATVPAGTAVTLSAQVSANGGPVSNGIVDFCDAAAKVCAGIAVVGTAPVNSGAVAVSITATVGAHSYVAVYQPTRQDSAATSNTVTLTVSGPIPTTTTFTVSSQSGGMTSLTVAVAGWTSNASDSPSGTVSFNDAASNLEVGTGTLATSNPGGFTLQPGANLPTSDKPSAIAVGRFAGANIGIAVANSNSNTLTVYTGDGKGDFTPLNPSAAIGAPGGLPSSIAVIDNQDLAVAESGSNSVQMLHGDGAGNFIATESYPAGSGPIAIATADFNGDGNLDLAVLNTRSQNVTILLGNGNGTYTPAAESPATGSLPDAIVAGDFNGDGIPDLAVANAGAGTITILLGNGDGTFTVSSKSPAAGSAPASIVATDFNRDGILDLVVASPSDGQPVVLQGNGDGTFTPYFYGYDMGGLSSLVVADFTQSDYPYWAGTLATDGQNWVVMFDNTSGAIANFTLPSGYSFSAIAAADVNNDGFPDLVIAGANSTGTQAGLVAIVLAGPQSIATASASLNLAAGAAVYAQYPGDALFGPSLSATQNIAPKTATSLTVTYDGETSNSSLSLPVGQPVTLVATLNPYAQGSSTTDGEQITFTANNAPIGTVPLSGGVAKLVYIPMQRGSFGPGASYPGDAVFAPAIGHASSDIFDTPDQPSLALVASPSSTAQGQAVELTAILSGSYQTDGETIQFSSNGAPLGTAMLSSGTATLQLATLAPGLDRLTASYAGDANNDPAGSPVFDEGVAASGQAVVGLALSITSGGAGVTTTASGAPVLLTASATASSAPVTAGTVTFWDLSTPGTASLKQRIGVAQLTPGGSASIVVKLAPGPHALQASFAGTANAAPSASTTAALNVTGSIPTFTRSTFYNNTIFAQVIGLVPYGRTQLFPGGTVQFVDQTAGNQIIEQTPTGANNYYGANFGDGIAGPAAGIEPFSVASADFNADGNADLAVANSGDGTVGIFLGNGDGTFQKQVAYAAGSGPFAVAVGDFNNDGRADLAVTNFSANTVSILLGNGDGTFQPQRTYATGARPGAIAVADFNGDGQLDLAIANNAANTVSLLAGNGDGTFAPHTVFPTGAGPDALVVADFNGDGIPDLAVANNGDATVSVLLGTGSGFSPQVTYPTGHNPVSLAAVDINGDGYLDLAVANLADSTFSALFGNGDGTFQPQVATATGNGPEAIVAGNFLGTGSPALAIANSGDNTVSYWTWSQIPGFYQLEDSEYQSGGIGPVALATADLLNNGLSGLVAVNTSSNSLGILPNLSGQTSLTSTFVSTVASAYPGDQSIVAQYGGDANFLPSIAAPGIISNPDVGTTVSLGASVDPASYGQSVTLTATVTPYQVSGVSTDGSRMQFNLGSTVIGYGLLASGVASLTVGNLPVGVNSLAAFYGGANGFNGNHSSISLIVRPAPLTVTAPQISRPYGAPNPSLTGVASGAVNGDTFAVTGTTTATQSSSPGVYTIVPSVSGSDLANYTVTEVNGALTVTRATPAIALSSSQPMALLATQVTFTATVTSSAGEPTGSISFYDGQTLLATEPLASGAASFATASLAAGAHSITAAYSGDADFVPVTSTPIGQAVNTFSIIPSGAGGSSATVSPGGAAIYVLTFDPPPGTTFLAAVTFSISGLPAGATANFSPSSIAAGTGPTNVSLTVHLPASAALPPLASPVGRSGLPLALACLLFPFALRLRRPGAAARLIVLTAAGGALLGLAVLTGCGGGSSAGAATQSQPQTYTLTVTAASGGLSTNTSLTLSVQ